MIKPLVPRESADVVKTIEEQYSEVQTMRRHLVGLNQALESLTRQIEIARKTAA